MTTPCYTAGMSQTVQCSQRMLASAMLEMPQPSSQAMPGDHPTWHRRIWSQSTKTVLPNPVWRTPKVTRRTRSRPAQWRKWRRYGCCEILLLKLLSHACLCYVKTCSFSSLVHLPPSPPPPPPPPPTSPSPWYNRTSLVDWVWNTSLLTYPPPPPHLLFPPLSNTVWCVCVCVLTHTYMCLCSCICVKVLNSINVYGLCVCCQAHCEALRAEGYGCCFSFSIFSR